MRRKARPPMLVMRHMHNTDLEIKERMAVQAFTMGVATKQHFDLLLDMMNMLVIGGSTSPERKYAVKYVDSTIQPALQSIRDRYYRTGKFGVNAAELKVFTEMIEFSKQFWNRQPIELYHRAGVELKAYYAELAEKRRKGRENDRSEAGVGNT